MKKNTSKPRATAKTKAAPRKGAATSATKRPTSRRAPGLTDQQRLDAIGLGLMAAAVFFAFVFYFGWQGGNLGNAIATGMEYLIGQGAYLVPLGLAAAGFVAILRSVLPERAVRWPAVTMLCAGILLALSAGLFGLGAPVPAKHVVFDPEWYKGHGGLIGETLYWPIAKLTGAAGAGITAVALMVTGLLQMIGVPIVEIGERLLDAIDRFRHPVANQRAETPAARKMSQAAKQRADEVVPPEPVGVEPVVRATHVEMAPVQEELPEIEEQPHFDANEVELVEPEIDPDPVVVPDADVPIRVGRAASVTEAEEITYKMPSAKVLERSKATPKGDNKAAQQKVATQLTEALKHFGIESTLVGTVAGPHVTRFELRLAPGTKMSKVSGLRDDLAYALASTDIRILAPIPGKQAVGVEVPNINRAMVRLGDVYQPLPKEWSPVSVWLGKDIGGKAIGTDIAKMPHLLVAGTTGAGKSGCINTLLCSILLGSTPNEVKLVLIDPKQVELNLYEQIPHLLTPVVTSPRMAANVLNNLIREMEQRYTLMSAYKCRNLVELNDKRKKEGEPTLPYILCVIDELADLMMVAPGEVEDAIIRLAQKARAIGIHLLLATQRPSADIITGMIKANVPSRIAFAVSSQTDSRVILDQNGAESLLGQGDMLFAPIGSSKLQRIQGAYVTEEEIIKLTDFWRAQGEPEFHEELLEAPEAEDAEDRDGLDPDTDDLLAEAIRTVVEMGTASTSMIQRRLRVGYTRAGRLIDMMERRLVISGYEGSKARQVLITEGDLPRVLAALSGQPELPEPESVLMQTTAEHTLEQPSVSTD
ncbi:MAG: DNA translocase FtsK 4TM domain-containing protein [Thermoleophilaceae bacterium]|nr:DNA translocase FtsK 4TM domain-containing protein [Thermoleophilaceae bacterium]